MCLLPLLAALLAVILAAPKGHSRLRSHFLVSPISIERDDNSMVAEGQQAEICGFERIIPENATATNGYINYSEKLLEAEIPLVDFGYCKNYWKNNEVHAKETQICAGADVKGFGYVRRQVSN
ncbi:hypothetical protein L596_030442 [Steinernema carpocapsae]|uniref:Peptidase S1 domain-containing protein n=1 Tax=Steinernema carpocapsae TaxID=34508 RepID=A0A4U5LPF8_STECR|nr:hypothetical protein L596_030442 [Steinernema carpocapsae]